MKVFKEEIYIDKFQSNIIEKYLGDMKYAVFDIETTGLSSKRSKVILIGLAYYEKGKLAAKQILAENRSEEKELLLALNDELMKFDYVITYNGIHFDIPFICDRYKHYGILQNIPYNLDIYHLLRYYSDINTCVQSMSQKSIEEYMGLSDKRTDEISGKENVKLYDEYEATKDPKLEQVIRLHNFDDIVQLYKLQSTLLKTDIHRAFFHAGYPVKSKNFGSLEIKKIRFKGGELIVVGNQHNFEGLDFNKYQDFENNIKISMNGNIADFEIVIPIHREPAGIYVDLKDFFSDDEIFQRLSGYIKGSLILMDKSKIQYEETNEFVKEILKNL